MQCAGDVAFVATFFSQALLIPDVEDQGLTLAHIGVTVAAVSESTVESFLWEFCGDEEDLLPCG